MSQREYDLVLFGATGFTGQLVADYIAGQVSEAAPLRWALAGRNRDKLEGVKAALAADHPHLDVAIEIADAQDAPRLDELAKDTTAICTTVGPYIWYGKKLLAACAQNGTHYCDLTGETPFIRHAIDAHHDEAVKSGARIVHCAGFDSIPSDVGTRVLQEYAIAQSGAPCTDVHCVVWRMKGGVSGGTAQSMIAIMEAAKDKTVRRGLGDPYSLVPGGKRGPDKGDSFAVEYDKRAEGWVAPFVMAAVNTRIVRRSNALLGYRYGEQFKYDEVMRTGRSFRARLTAQGVRLGMGALVGAAATGLGRKALQKFILPASGEGPDAAAQAAGFFHFKIFGRTDAGETFVAEVKGDKDPGYGQTAVMLGESALCLALDHTALDAAAEKGETVRAGVLTPASAMGEVLAERLRQAGMTFEAHAA